MFEIPSIRFSSRWGSSWNKWLKPTEPTFLITYYVSNSGKYTVDILAEDNTKLKSFTINAIEGYNYFEYDVSVSEKIVDTYFFKNEISVKRAKNNKYYLPKGNYTIKISGAKESAEQKLMIK